MARTAYPLIREVPLKEELTLKDATDGLKEFAPLNTMVQIYQGGKKTNKKLHQLNGYQFFINAIYGRCTEDELKTLHHVDSIVNETIKALTSETTNYISNMDKNIINKRLFARGEPRELSEEAIELLPKDAAQEFREFRRLCEEGTLIYDLEYRNKDGKIVTVKCALADKDYEIDKDMPWFIVSTTDKEDVYFKKHGYFPLRCDTDNSKLGKKWMYLAFELAWLCSGDAHGGCQCPEYCYARHMERTYKNVRDRVLKFMNAWENHNLQEKIDFYTTKIMWNRNGIRFCDTGDVTNQEMLNEIFALVRGISKNLKDKGVDPIGRFYIYSTRADLDWSNKPWELVLNASNKKLFKKVPDANWFRVVKSFDDIPKKYLDPEILHICNCNCKACDYCAVCRNQVIWEVLG